MLVSPHAVLRFVKRYRPDLTEKDAEPILALLASAAERVGPTRGGDLYRVELADGRRLSMVVRDDPTTDRVVVTVLPPNADTMPPEEVDEIVEAFERISSPPSQAAVKRATVRDAAPARQPPRDKADAQWVERNRFEKAQRDLERARRHGDRQNLEYEVARDALKIAIRALIRIDSNTAYTAIERIRAIEPAWLSEGFIEYEPDEASMARRAERRRAMTSEK